MNKKALNTPPHPIKRKPRIPAPIGIIEHHKIPTEDYIRIMGSSEWYIELSKASLADAINVLIREGRIKL